MEQELFVGTDHGLLVVRNTDGFWQVVSAGLDSSLITSVIAREGVILAGTTKGVFRSDDHAHSWTPASVGLSVGHVRWMAYNPKVSDFEFAGTEPASIFVSHDGAESWRECSEVTALRDLHHWFLPYSKYAGCIRGFAFNGSRAYAAAEVGGLLRSEDGGDSWRLAPGSNGSPDLEGSPEPLVYPDVHSVEVYPATPDKVYAATGGGLYISEDSGERWKCVYDCYCRAVWVDPADPNHLILGSAEGVSRGGQIEETIDGGKNWRPASEGLVVPWRDYMVERFAQIGGELFAVLSNGELITSSLRQLNWTRTIPDVENITCVTLVRE